MASTRHLGQSRPQSGAAGAAADDAAGRQWVVAIGIDEYLHWPRLANAVADAKGVQRLFTEKLGFAAVREPLLDAEAAAAALTALARDELPQLLKPVDSLLLFFAGHGQTRRTQVGTKTVETGYLVPAPARRDQFGDLLPIDTFLRDLSKLPAQHVLVLIDACHSGFALGQAVDRTRGSAEYRNDIASRLSRKVITSAMGDQEALDGGPVAGHSLFTGTLVGA